MKKFLISLFALFAATAVAFGQSPPSNPAMTYGMVPTVGQWNNWFQQKQDTLGFTPLNQAGGTMLGPLKTSPSTTSAAGFSVLPGVGPNVPNNGDIWLTSSGLFYRADNITFGPIGDGTITGPGSTVVGHVAKWGDTAGQTLTDGGALGTAATQNTGTSGANVPLLNGDNTWSARQSITMNTPIAVLNALASGQNRIISGATNGLTRWIILPGDSVTESGSNAGSNFGINRYNDAGTFVDSPLTINRATGVVALSQPLPAGSGGTGITSLGGGIPAFLGTPSSSNLATAITDETGSGALVFGTSPALTTPNLGTPSAATLTNATGLPLTTGITGTLGLGNGGTGATTAANARTNLGLGTLATLNSVAAAQMPTGSVVDSISTTYTANTTITGSIPVDNTIPQNTEGTQILSLSLTPKSTTDKFRCRTNGAVFGASADTFVWSMFSSTVGANAIVAGYQAISSATQTFHGETEFTPGVASAVTVSVRVGTSSGINIAMNGNVGTPLLGGSSAAILVCEEIKA